VGDAGNGANSTKSICYRNQKTLRILFVGGWVTAVREFSVLLRIVAAFSMTVAVLAATIGFAGPALAVPARWVMPEVRNMVLQQAIKEIREVTGSAQLDLSVEDRRNGQEVHNQTNWLVCAQSPRAGGVISQKSKRVLLLVKRFNQQRCTS